MTIGASHLEEDVVLGSDGKVVGVEEAVLDNKAGSSQLLPVGSKLFNANRHVSIPKRLQQTAQPHTSTTVNIKLHIKQNDARTYALTVHLQRHMRSPISTHALCQVCLANAYLYTEISSQTYAGRSKCVVAWNKSRFQGAVIEISGAGLPRRTSSSTR